MVGAKAVAEDVNPVHLPTGSITEVGPAGGTVVVEKGDHLWKISARALGRPASDRAIGPYWLEVIDINRPHLRSGDPDLIYPGELVTLPEVSERR